MGHTIMKGPPHGQLIGLIQESGSHITHVSITMVYMLFGNLSKFQIKFNVKFIVKSQGR